MMKNQFAPIFTPYGYYLTPTGQNMPYMPPMPPMEQPFPIMQNMPPMRMPNAFY